MNFRAENFKIPNSSIIFLFTALFFFNFLSRILLAPLSLEIESQLNLTHTQTGSFFFILQWGYLISMIVSSVLVSKITHRSTLIISSLMISLSLFLCGLSSNYLFFCFSVALIGFGAGIYLPSAIAVITSVYEKNDWGKVLSIHELAPNFSFFFAPFFAEILMKYFNFRIPFFISSAGILFFLFLFVLKIEQGKFKSEKISFRSYFFLLKMKSFWIMLVLFVLGITATLGVFNVFPLYLVESAGITRSIANKMIGYSRISTIFIVLIVGLVSHRIGYKRIIFVSLLFTGMITFLIPFVNQKWVFIFVFFQPLLAVCFFPAGFSTLAAIAPKGKRNLVISLIVPIASLTGGGFVPALIGYAADLGILKFSFSAIGGVIFVLSFIVFFLPQD